MSYIVLFFVNLSSTASAPEDHKDHLKLKHFIMTTSLLPLDKLLIIY